ncbi:hypothetical protein F5Y18DRAFT_170887 [Xylariaceae sp. FL1019]|nr:hypothetical protein F5Y18DRAFT_170887 [Xylariaceae sp. FL1019]
MRPYIGLSIYMINQCTRSPILLFLDQSRHRFQSRRLHVHVSMSTWDLGKLINLFIRLWRSRPGTSKISGPLAVHVNATGRSLPSEPIPAPFPSALSQGGMWQGSNSDAAPQSLTYTATRFFVFLFKMRNWVYLLISWIGGWIRLYGMMLCPALDNIDFLLVL